MYKAALAALFAAVLSLASLSAATRPQQRAGVSAAPYGSGQARPFRLGTAARPFGWSTAIGDLNADGRPDYAIADRIGRRASGFEYALELSISGIGSQSISFDSTQDALAVTLRDVDHDSDLDVVVTALLSRAVVGVWLNDGAGRFHDADTLASVSAWQSTESLTNGGYSLSPAAIESASRKVFSGLGAKSTARVVLAAIARLGAHDCAGSRTLHSTNRRARAPPAGTVSILA